MFSLGFGAKFELPYSVLEVVETIGTKDVLFFGVGKIANENSKAIVARSNVSHRFDKVRGIMFIY